MYKELVIAAYDKNYRWTNDIDASVDITIYVKGDGYKSVKPFPKLPHIRIDKHIGRDVHTFYYHIVNRYDNLSDYTFFSQDFPFDHVANITELLNGNLETWNRYSILTIDANCWFFNTYCKDLVLCDKLGYPNHGGLNIEPIWNNLFQKTCPNQLKFPAAGHFCASKECIRKRPKSFYETILKYLESDVNAPWVIERLNGYIFGYYD